MASQRKLGLHASQSYLRLTKPQWKVAAVAAVNVGRAREDAHPDKPAEKAVAAEGAGFESQHHHFSEVSHLRPVAKPL